MDFKKLVILLWVAGLATWGQYSLAGTAVVLTAKQQLGKKLFFETRLSNPPGQACATCHAPGAAFSDPRHQSPVSAGAHKGMVTSRNAPSIMYLAGVPALHFDTSKGSYIGGLFYDGRAASLEEQVAGPGFGRNEMAIKDKPELIDKLRKLGYQSLFQQIFGARALVDTKQGYRQFTEVLAAYERSAELNPFSSKYDYYLLGKTRLSVQEHRGLRIFEDEKKGNCAACHPTTPQDDGTRPMFTDYSYDNLGVPKNPANPFLQLRGEVNPQGQQFIDLGLGKTVARRSENGKFRVPSLRNVDVTAPYMHNGMFKTLHEVIDFYNSRDVDPKWAKAEVLGNVNKDEMGRLRLTEQEMADLLAFLKTLTDGYPLSTK